MNMKNHIQNTNTISKYAICSSSIDLEFYPHMHRSLVKEKGLSLLFFLYTTR